MLTAIACPLHGAFWNRLYLYCDLNIDHKFMLMCEIMHSNHVRNMKYSLLPIILFVLALYFYIYILMDDNNLNTYIKQIHQILYESINILKRILFWDIKYIRIV
jgi:hypothetical protein